jgi:hypothetical protein
MSNINKGLLFGLIAAVIPVQIHLTGGPIQTDNPEVIVLEKSGKKYSIGSGYSLIYEYSKKPAIGLLVLKLRIFEERSGKQVHSLNVSGESGMPSMRGAHDSGEKTFQLNKKGDYLLPIDVVMAGKWEVVLRVKDKGTTLFTGTIAFRV